MISLLYQKTSTAEIYTARKHSLLINPYFSVHRKILYEWQENNVQKSLFIPGSVLLNKVVSQQMDPVGITS